MKLETGIWLGFGAAVGALATALAITYWGAARTLEASRRVAHTHEVQRTLDRVGLQLYRAEAGQRGYLITVSRPYLEERNAALALLATEVDSLQHLTASKPQQQKNIGELRQAIAARIEIFEHFVKLRQEKGLEAARQQFGPGLGVTARIRETINAMHDEENRLLAERSKQEQAYLRATRWGSVAVLVFLAAFLGVVARRNAREIAKQQRLTAILEATPDFVATARQDGEVTYINRAGRKMLGLGETGPLHGLEIAGTQPAWALDIVRNRGIPEALHSGCWTGETALLARDGREIPVSQAIIAHRGSTGFLSTIARDISAIKRNEQELALLASYDRSYGEALTLFGAVFERAGILHGVLEILARNHFCPVSAFYAYNEWGGVYHCEATRGTPAQMLREFRPGEGLPGEAARAGRTVLLDDDQGRFRLAIEAGVAAIEPAAILAVPVTCQERKLGLLVLASTRKPDERDKVFFERLAAQIGVALHNVKQYEDLTLLAGEMRARSEEISRKNVQLEEMNRLKSEFLASMSHELKTPLSAIIGFSEALKDGIMGELTLEQREALGDIFSSGRQLLSLINDILDLSRIEAGSMTLEPEALDMRDLLRAGLAVVREKALARKIRLVSDIADDVGEMQADARKTKQIVYNLLSNAVKFTGEGGTVTLAARMVGGEDAGRLPPGMPGMTVLAPAPPCERYLEISVSDTGIGISETGMQRLFRPFVQLDGSLARKYEGTGLGLTMVLRLTELQGGAVALQSRVGEGSRFLVWLPWREAGDSAGAAPATVPAAATQREAPKVLVVDDDPASVRLIATYLEKEQFGVLRAYGGMEGMEAAQRERPQLIILDLLMPEMGGFELLDALKARPDTASIPIIILTVKELSQAERQALEGRVVKIIEKAQFEPAAFIAEVRRALEDGRE